MFERLFAVCISSGLRRFLCCHFVFVFTYLCVYTGIAIVLSLYALCVQFYLVVYLRINTYIIYCIKIYV